jgi:phenylpropionate dioxygenase-like ring-hydroxylating dioxygenase large terminal subunit
VSPANADARGGSPRYPLPPVPDGWYAVGDAGALAPGEVRPARWFGRDLVLFRTHAGAPRLLDAHCPHLGAHLGHGGCVEDDGIRCPFHGWRFDGEGRLVEVPGLDREPPKARVRGYPVRELEGRLFAWFHARDAAPDWEPPEVREGDPARWTAWTTQRWEVRTHVQDIAENILDRAHFLHVHDMEAPDAPRFEIAFDGPAMTVEQNMKMKNEASVSSRTTNWGPGISLTRVDVGPVHSVTFITHTPVEPERVEFQLSFSMHRLEDPVATARVERLNRETTNLQASQDMPIWENKVYRERPILTAVDGPVHEYRRWYRRFYSDWNDPGAT